VLLSVQGAGEGRKLPMPDFFIDLLGLIQYLPSLEKYPMPGNWAALKTGWVFNAAARGV
jgi:hypothetical protein